MRIPPFAQGVRTRLGLLIVLAMVALVGYLIYDGIQERADEKQRARDDLERLARFAATAERSRFDATANFFTIVKQAEVMTTMAASPGDQAAYDACTRGLYISDQLVPGTRFSLWDVNGDILCSSRGAKTGEFSAAGARWFIQTKQKQGFAAGDFELIDGDGAPALSFGTPITDPLTNEVVAYLSGAVEVRSNVLPTGASLPQSGRLTIVDQHGVVINSTGRAPGERLPLFPDSFAELSDYQDSSIEEGNGRMGAAVRITDSDDALVSVIVSAETDTLVTPLGESIVELLIPIAVITLLTLLAVFFLSQRWIIGPIEALGAVSDALASGDLGARAKARTGVSEFDALAARFNEMAETRERASRAKDEFLGLVSHELKTPITMTLGNAEILRNRGDRVDPELRQTAVEDIHESTLRLASIVDNLLVLARLERGAGLDEEPVSVLRMAEVAAARASRRTPGRRCVVSGDSSALALGGETYVDQVLQNLIGNAVKYSPRNETVEVIVEPEGDMVVTRVLDRGPGIDESEIEAVFEPFYRSDRTANVAEGIGIGLSVCRRLVEAMGGDIWAKAREGGGSEFGFRLRLVTADAHPALEREGEAAAGGALTVSPAESR